SAVLALTVLAARRHQSTVRSELGTIRNLLVQARIGLAIMRRPGPAATAAAFQSFRWLCQLFAVWTSMRAFNIHQPLTVPGDVLALIDLPPTFPLCPRHHPLPHA